MTCLMRALSIGLFISLMFANSAQAQAPVSVVPVDAGTNNQSVTIATGNTFQQILPAASPSLSNSNPRRSLTIQNNNTSDSCWIFIGSATATKAASILLDTAHGTAYTRFMPFVPNDVIQATCANNGDTLYVDTQ